jgi:hypothetical protein
MIQLIFLVEHIILVCKSGFWFSVWTFLVKVNSKHKKSMKMVLWVNFDQKVQTKNVKALLHTRIMRSIRKTSWNNLYGVKTIANAEMRSYTPG